MASALFTPLKVRGLTLPNRVWASPMCQYTATDGVANLWHVVHYGAMATGGAGLVLMESTAVMPEGRISADDLGLWNDDQAQALETIVEFAHTQGTKLGVQIAHAGRKASTYAPGKGEGTLPLTDGGWQTVAPVATHYGAERPPNALDEKGIRMVVQATAAAAGRAADLGFDVLEIQAPASCARPSTRSGQSGPNTFRYSSACPPQTGWKAGGRWPTRWHSHRN